ncbi:hypothetical protein C2S51_005466 [Perilla frutescens var. frutescens]|nr:hypothetical protein C2S51_005466 [Perilla frutescens var. frutescens]
MKIHVSILFLNITAVVSFFCVAFSDVMCRERDRAALLMFKNDLHDPAGRLSSWRGGANCCKWAGVVCDNITGEVHELRLRNPHDVPCSSPSYDAAQFEAYSTHKLGGKLNPSLLNIDYLTHLDLSCNDFEGAGIPDFVSSMINLHYLDLSSSGFVGAIPHQFGNLSRLQFLNLGDPYSRNYGSFESKLSIRDVQWLSYLSSLKHLDLSGVDVSEASDWVHALESLPSLLELRLSRCGLKPPISINAVNFARLSLLDLSWNDFNSLVPHWIYSLGNLVHLNLSHCGFYDQLPVGLLNMTKLEYLNLSSNNFTSPFPKGFSGLGNLKVLAVADNLIEGEIPSTLGDLTSLAILDLSGNRLEGMLPESLSNLCNVKELYLYGNRFSGDFPTFSGCISDSLRLLYLGSNKFSGPLPSNLEHLARLRELDLATNKLTGPLPTNLGQLHELEYLVISDNSFEGVVSESHFRNLSRLKIFRANGNRFIFKPRRSWIPPFQLEGLTLRSWQLGPEFPIWIKHLKHLQYLSFASTGIVDTIPTWFWNMTSQMKYLNLSNNMIKGEIPSLLDFGLSRNVAIDMNHNLISGPLPSISSNVTILDLSYNLISGSMNHFLCSNAEQNMKLEILDLGYNSLSGEIPDCWGNWSLLSVLRLQANNLSGKIPSSIGLLARLQSLHLRGNNLSRQVPVSLQNCVDLMVLDFGRNHLTGRIPLWIHKLSKLAFFNLRLNEFSGNIPVELCRLASLQALDLAGNNLSGRIPACFNSFSVMAGKHQPSGRMYYSAYDTFGGVRDSQYLVVKGRFGLYSSILHWVMTLDLSDNNLTGTIPVQIALLSKLQTLNLSRNSLTGSIPQNIGNMNLLESLDLSKNKLSGQIPQSISELTFLSNLNLSYNNLTGRIPSGTQLEGFDSSSFVGNELCGPPLSEKCSVDEETLDKEDEEEGDTSILGEGLGFFLSILLGFVVGFWTVIASLVLNMSWRNAYFGLFERIGNYIYYVCAKCLRR